MKLFECTVTRSIRCRWMLQELDVPFESEEIIPGSPESKSERYLSICPTGKIPSLTDGEFSLFESVAICTYLGDKFPGKNLVPRPGSKERAKYDQWMFFGMTELEQPLWTIARHTSIYPESKRIPAIREIAAEEFRTSAPVLNHELSRHDYILGDEFTAADIIIGHIAIWAGCYKTPKLFKLIDDFPHIQRYIATLNTRPRLPAALRELIANN